MRHAKAIAVLALLGGACTVVQRESHASRAERAARSAEAFEVLKSLAGKWSGEAGEGSNRFAVEATYEIVSAGTAVMERLFPGTPHEMVTLYHRDGPGLVMTHYCSQGNQPRMDLRAFLPAPHDALIFSFRDATNHASPQELVMHDMSLHRLGPDRIQVTWTAWVNGKADHTANFDLERQLVHSLGY